jgi:hypothetical protein
MHVRRRRELVMPSRSQQNESCLVVEKHENSNNIVLPPDSLLMARGWKLFSALASASPWFQNRKIEPHDFQKIHHLELEESLVSSRIIPKILSVTDGWSAMSVKKEILSSYRDESVSE